MKKLILIPFASTLAFGSFARPLPASPFDEALQSVGALEEAGQWLAVRNQLSRVLEWDRLSPDLSGAEKKDLQARREAANQKWLASLPPPPEETPVRGARRSRRRARSIAVADVTDTATVGEILAQAEAARNAGRLETALRLYRAAARLPGGEDAAKAAAEIEAEVGGQAER